MRRERLPITESNELGLFLLETMHTVVVAKVATAEVRDAVAATEAEAALVARQSQLLRLFQELNGQEVRVAKVLPFGQHGITRRATPLTINHPMTARGRLTANQHEATHGRLFQMAGLRTFAGVTVPSGSEHFAVAVQKAPSPDAPWNVNLQILI